MKLRKFPISTAYFKWLKYCSAMLEIQFLSSPREIFSDLCIYGLVTMIIVMWERRFQGRGGNLHWSDKGL